MIEELIRNGQLIKTAQDSKKAIKSLELAGRNIEKARCEAEAGIHDSALVSAYTAMFHTARAILFKDGYKERGHYALYTYLREKHGADIEMKYVTELNVLRTIRHKVIYGDEDVNAKDVQGAEAESAIAAAKEFLAAVRKYLSL